MLPPVATLPLYREKHGEDELLHIRALIMLMFDALFSITPPQAQSCSWGSKATKDKQKEWAVVYVNMYYMQSLSCKV